MPVGIQLSGFVAFIVIFFEVQWRGFVAQLLLFSYFYIMEIKSLVLFKI